MRWSLSSQAGHALQQELPQDGAGGEAHLGFVEVIGGTESGDYQVLFSPKSVPF